MGWQGALGKPPLDHTAGANLRNSEYKSNGWLEFGRRNFTDLGKIALWCQQCFLTQAVTMNTSTELNFEEMLRVRLGVLKREHRDLDDAIHALELSGRPDALTLRRLKKQKLALKDHIVKIEDDIIPDIIA